MAGRRRRDVRVPLQGCSIRNVQILHFVQDDNDCASFVILSGAKDLYIAFIDDVMSIRKPSVMNQNIGPIPQS